MVAAGRDARHALVAQHHARRRQVAAHAVIEATRSAARRKDKAPEADVADHAPGPATRFEQAEYQERLERCVEKALGSLASSSRRVIELRFFASENGKQKSKTFAEIGALLGKSADAVRVQCGRALAAMADSVAACLAAG